jgi:hypothetical protein
MSTYPGERCQRVKINGTQCGSPAIRDTKFCYFHTWCRPAQVDVSTSAAVPPAPFLLPVLEDAASIQLAITQVCEHLLHRRLDAKKAGILLYAMQVASSNLGRLNQNQGPKKSSKKNEENAQEKSVEASSPVPASSDATLASQDDSGSISSGEPDRLPPGTIHACEQPRRFVV